MKPISSCRATVKLLSSRPGLRQIILAALIAAPCFALGLLTAASELTEQGQNIAQRLCAACHAIGRAERSPIPVAPAFRRMEPRVDLEQMAERLQTGIIVGHPEMPAFVLKEYEARALLAYIRSLRDN